MHQVSGGPPWRSPGPWDPRSALALVTSSPPCPTWNLHSFSWRQMWVSFRSLSSFICFFPTCQEHLRYILIFWPHHVACGDLTFPTNDQTHTAPLQWKRGVLTTGPPAKSQVLRYFEKTSSSTCFSKSHSSALNSKPQRVGSETEATCNFSAIFTSCYTQLADQ